MTYCVAIKIQAGLVLLSDSRTNAGLDHISTFRKMQVYERPGERCIFLLTAGNLSISQSVRENLPLQQLRDDAHSPPITLWNAKSMFDVARLLGAAVRHVYDRDGVALKRVGVDFHVSLLLAGQIHGEDMRLFQVYAAGNFIEATPETPYFQIGEAKYGKPVLDRMLHPELPLAKAAKCALISMDSTLKSNVSVGLPLDLAVYEANSLRCNQLVSIDEASLYFQMLRRHWATRLREVFEHIEDPVWDSGPTAYPLRGITSHSPHKVTAPPDAPSEPPQ